MNGTAHSPDLRLRPIRVLLLGHNYAPEQTGIGPYNTQLAEHLAANGCHVTVLTTFAHYPRYRWAVRPPLWQQEIVNGVRLKRLRVIMPRKPNTFWRVVFDCSVGLSYVANAMGTRRADVIVATVPTLQGGLVASLLARLWRARAVLMIQDLPVEAGLAVGMLRQGVALRLAKRIERFVFRAAHHSVVISEAFREILLKDRVNESRISVIHDWVDLDRVRPASADADVRIDLAGSANGFLVLHAGSMAAKQGLETVVNAAKLLADDRDIHTVLVGDGPAKPGLQDQVAKANLSNIRFLEIQPDSYFPRMLAAADALLLNQRADVLEAVAPSKLLNYLAAGRPIIAAVNRQSVAAKMVTESLGGVVVDAEDPAGLAAAIKGLRRDPELRIQMGLHGRKYAESMFGKDIQLQRWSRVIAAVARRTTLIDQSQTEQEEKSPLLAKP